MALESANNFVKKYFEDEEFLRKLYRNGGFISGPNIDADMQNANTIQVAKKMGFDFNLEEYNEANKEYANSIGKWNSIKKLFHIMKVIKKIEKEEKKKKK